jgi:predicted nuclease with TOPRIM domain
MEKKISLTWSEIWKWGTMFALVISLFVANQVDIKNLKSENADLKKDNKELTNAVANINGKLDEIKGNVDTIKDALINSVFNSDGVNNKR